jgi:putative Mg2+ transporter-C (MgtC) family protein
MDVLTFLANIGSALAMGVAIGLERQLRQKTAGLRTNALVCVGAALFVSLSIMTVKDADPTRVAGQVVSGIGFLGGGVILREGFSVRGLATAATLWCSAAVGTLAGAGMIVHGFIGTGMILFIHVALRPIALKIEFHGKGIWDADTIYRMRVTCPTDQAVVIRSIFMRHVNSQPGMVVQGIAVQDAEQLGRSIVVVEIFSSHQDDKRMNELVSRISIEPSVSAVSWEKTR